MKMGFLPLLLVLLSGDVETNPGPLAPLARGPNLEKVHKMSEWQMDKMTGLIGQTVGRFDNLKNKGIMLSKQDGQYKQN